MKTYELTDYDYFRLGQQLITAKNVMSVSDEYFYLESQDNYRRTWALGFTGDGELYITHDQTDVMFPLHATNDFWAYKTIRDVAQIFDNPQRETFGAKFGSYDGE